MLFGCSARSNDWTSPKTLKSCNSRVLPRHLASSASALNCMMCLCTWKSKNSLSIISVWLSMKSSKANGMKSERCVRLSWAELQGGLLRQHCSVFCDFFFFFNLIHGSPFLTICSWESVMHAGSTLLWQTDNAALCVAEKKKKKTPGFLMPRVSCFTLNVLAENPQRGGEFMQTTLSQACRFSQ